nr:huntingtin-interacting protein 1 isoform X2 [Helicoverpa armigera]XP_049694412.1 huntingtin-interacting protein 1 isoform X2 [Helicoverpa armigera]XP_049694414.1 huntingtin-interacting protein 1 isoform X2 [Helicoverpa armigera]XP_049694415.1 huntingtin-interacting protein 1 isoform X2 [Helicoverpa armigera]
MANPNDKRFYQLTLAIQKAINAIETPVKEKHVRSTLIGTFKEQSAITYWMVAIRLPLQENRIVAWKFCHVTHKLLREGHPACLDDSQRHIGMIENLGKLWVHLREGYGKLVHLYCNLLVCKLKFHSRNPRFPGNMQLTAEELDAIAENDVNNYFQLCVELFDYMDEILNLQASVFDSLGNARANSMTASGQCRLAALIPCAQDASQIYDCNVRLLFRLHASLPADTLAGHRERFRQQFKKLSSFYKHASSLQYYRNLLTLPVLPSNPPNFLQQSDFGTYVTPVVSIPEPPPDEVDSVASLIDTSDTMSQVTVDNLEDFDNRPTSSPQPDPIVERDRLIDHLQNELKRMRSEVSQLVQERNTMIGSMKEHCTRIETQLHNAKVELEEEKHKAEILSAQTPEIKQKLTETEEKAKVTDEKFQKLKGAYTQLREEHIALIRQKAEVDKLSASLRAAAAQHESAKLALQQQLNDRIKDVELLQQSASSSEEIEAYKSEILSLRSDLEQSRQKEAELETLKASMEALEIEHNTATKEQEEKLTTVTNELKETTENLERITQEKEQREIELNRVKEELVGLRESSGDEYKKVVEEKEAALKQVAELQQQHLQEKEEQKASYEDQLKECNCEITILKDRLQNVTECKDEIITNLKSMVAEKDGQVISLNVEVTQLTDENSRLKDELTETQAELEIGKNELFSLRDEHDKIVEINESNLAMKNQELRELHDQVKELSEQKTVLERAKEKISCDLTLEKEVLESKILELTVAYENLTKDNDDTKSEKETLEIQLNNEINKLKLEFEQLKDEKEIEIQSLNTKIENQETEFNEALAVKDASIAEAETNIQQLKDDLEQLHKQKADEKEEMASALSAKEHEMQLLETRLGHAESKRLNAECELQDLLQHNTVLEADLSAVKRQLAEAQKALEEQKSRLVTCAGEAALEVASGALTSFEHGRDTVGEAAELAAKALEELSSHTEVSGNEESVAKSAIIAAHNTAQLSAYVAEVSNVSTDMALADKLNTECRSMLSATKECLESIKSGSVDSSHCSDVRTKVRSLMTAAAAADRLNSGARSVDDELADMDKAIEEAASQIENMLAATRAGDSGVKLEVNGKILDACTTLMGAVKILVQDARKLQNELGDPKTRQKMYRKNPQWSEGLISAAKAVVFAAKLLVTSADEAVGASGQVEGVSAAAHEVAGSTAQLVAASRARAPPGSPALSRLTQASRSVAAATGALVAAVRAGSALVLEQEALDTSSLSLTATRRLEMESKVRSLKLETALDAERSRLAALRKRHYQLAQMEENGNMENGKD